MSHKSAILWLGRHIQPMWHTGSVVSFHSAQMSGRELKNPGLTLSPLKINSKIFMDFLLLEEGGFLPPDWTPQSISTYGIAATFISKQQS